MAAVLTAAAASVQAQVGTMPIPQTDTAELTTTVQVVPGVSGGPPTEYIYRYTVTNPASSSDPLYRFSVDVSAEEGDFRRPVLQTVPKQAGAATLPVQDEIDRFAPFFGLRGENVVPIGLECPSGWTGGLRTDATVVCYAANGTPLIAPDESLSGFAIHSRFPPALRDIDTRAFWTVIVDSLETDESSIDREAAFQVIEGLKRPQRGLAPASFFPNRREHYSNFESDLAEMIGLGWIPDAALAAELTTIVDDAGELFRTGQGLDAKIRLEDLEAALAAAAPGDILDDAATHLSVSVDSIQEFGSNSFLFGGLDTEFRPTPEAASLTLGETFELSVFVYQLNVFNYEDGIVEEPIPDRIVYIGCDPSATVEEDQTACPNFSATGFGNRIEIFSDANGIATFSYQGTLPGRDTLEVCGDSFCESDFGPVVVDWGSEVDLVIQAFAPPLLKAGSGDEITFSDRTVNIGAGTSLESTTAYYLSDSEVVDPETAVFVGQRSIPALGQDGVSEVNDIQFTLPSGLPFGFYNLIACADDGDQVVESDELNNCSNVQLEGSEFVAVPVADFEDLFVVTINDVSTVEGDTGTTDAIFDVELSQPNPDADISFDFSIIDGTATRADNDFSGADGTITFAAGSGGPQTQQIVVSVVGDMLIENDETVGIELIPLTGDALYRTTIATLTIVDDDAIANTAPTADDQSVSTNQDTPVGVTLTGQDPDGNVLTFSIKTDPANGTLTGTAPELVYTPDAGFFGSDSFTFVANDGIVDSNVATASIQVNEVVIPVPTLTVADASVVEGDAGQQVLSFEITLSEPSLAGDVTATVSTLDGTALQGEDYEAVTTQIIFLTASTVLVQVVDVNIVGDFDVETDETFLVEISNVSTNVELSNNTATGTIENDDLVAVTISDASALEGDSGNTGFLFHVSIDQPHPTEDVFVNVGTMNGTAVGGEDFAVTATMLTFPAGGTTDLSQGVIVEVSGDTMIEPDEEFALAVTSVSPNAAALDGSGLGIILNDDLPPQLDCSPATATPNALWPPNHKLVDIEIGGVFDASGQPAFITVTSILQDEPVNGLGDGDSSPDGFGVGTDSPEVRSERSGTDDGRIYFIAFDAVDDTTSESCSGVVAVGVPHDLGQGSTPMDSGARYDSTAPAQ